MIKKQIITIGGSLGGGKSSTADLVARELNFKRFSSGDLFRKIGIEMGISLGDVSKKAETDRTIDTKTDEAIKNLGNSENIVIDTRLGFHFIPESFKVYLNLPPEIAKERIFKNLEVNPLRRQSEDSSTVNEIYEKIIRRLESEKKRYKELYNLDHTDKNNYDLVIDTNKNNLKEVVDIIVAEYKKWIAN